MCVPMGTYAYVCMGTYAYLHVVVMFMCISLVCMDVEVSVPMHWYG